MGYAWSNARLESGQVSPPGRWDERRSFAVHYRRDKMQRFNNGGLTGVVLSDQHSRRLEGPVCLLKHLKLEGCSCLSTARASDGKSVKNVTAAAGPRWSISP